MVRITEVGPRDGLQNEPGVISTADKVRLVELLCASGLDEIEVSSFVPARWIPQLADAAEVFDAAAQFKTAGTVFSALVPNERGLEAALQVNQRAGSRVIDKVSVFTAASETFAQRNTNASIEQTLQRFVPVIAAARRAGLRTRGYVSCAVACPFEGPIRPEPVIDVALRLRDLGVEEIDLADTIGVATPEQVDALLGVAFFHFRADELTLHLHDTYGRAGACAAKGYELGLRSFDGAVGGLGGCPYAATQSRKAPGNLATSTLIEHLVAAGGQVRVNRGALETAGRFARAVVDGGRGRDKADRR